MNPHTLGKWLVGMMISHGTCNYRNNHHRDIRWMGEGMSFLKSITRIMLCSVFIAFIYDQKLCVTFRLPNPRFWFLPPTTIVSLLSSSSPSTPAGDKERPSGSFFQGVLDGLRLGPLGDGSDRQGGEPLGCVELPEAMAMAGVRQMYLLCRFEAAER